MRACDRMQLILLVKSFLSQAEDEVNVQHQQAHDAAEQLSLSLQQRRPAPAGQSLLGGC